MIYLKLLWAFLQIGAFSFGGGYASLPLIQEQIVNIHGWMTMSELTDLVTISQMTPGPIAINSASFVGMQIAGVPGAIIATIGVVTPSAIIMAILGFFYFRYRNLTLVNGVLKGIHPAVVALIASAGLSLIIPAFWGEAGFSFNLLSVDFIAVALFILSIIALRKFKIPPVFVMLGCGVIGGIVYTLFV